MSKEAWFAQIPFCYGKSYKGKVEIIFRYLVREVAN